MLPAPIEHRFEIDGDPYCLVEWDRGQERRIRAEYAMAIAPAPNVLESMDGASLYAEAVARECLTEAPAIFWTQRPASTGVNGTPTRVVTLEHIPRVLWERFRAEVDIFVGKIFPVVPTEPESALTSRADESAPVALTQAVSPLLRGRAE